MSCRPMKITRSKWDELDIKQVSRCTLNIAYHTTWFNIILIFLFYFWYCPYRITVENRLCLLTCALFDLSVLFYLLKSLKFSGQKRLSNTTNNSCIKRSSRWKRRSRRRENYKRVLVCRNHVAFSLLSTPDRSSYATTLYRF